MGKKSKAAQLVSRSCYKAAFKMLWSAKGARKPMMEFWSKQLKEEVRTESSSQSIRTNIFLRHTALVFVFFHYCVKHDVFPGGGADEGADAADRQSLPSEGVEQEATGVLPLAALSELGPGEGSARHHLPHLAVPRHQCSVQEQQVSRDTPALSSQLRHESQARTNESNPACLL